VAIIDPDSWDGRQVLLTGHTGFKGAWLALWLQMLGARVSGLALAPPTEPSLYGLARVSAHMATEESVDIRDAAGVRQAVHAARPEIVVHLAAQPLVRQSLRDPVLTFAVNVLGTVHLLDAVRHAGDSVRAVIVVTSDKCYANHLEEPRRFVESDPLGGRDPYSSSKACAELVTASYRESFFSFPSADAARAGIATARAGNVIGGGDFGEERLVPDILRAHRCGETLSLRHPDAVRPWQHVLNPLSGYLRLAQALCEEAAGAGDRASRRVARAWNFGPPEQDCCTVSEIVRRLGERLDGALGVELDRGTQPPEAGRLELDSSAAEELLGWRPRWDLDEALAQVARWHVAERAGEDMRRVSLEQIEAFS
jgi:CDP-glucose 4,6-dehydratase